MIVSIDGIGAYDHISRAAMLTKLASLPTACQALPFVRMFYAQPPTYWWTDADGTTHEIVQAEGGEQGDALMPPLYALGQHEGLVTAQRLLPEGDTLVAYLDDIYLLTQRQHARVAFDIVTGCIAEHCGVSANMGKCPARPGSFGGGRLAG